MLQAESLSFGYGHGSLLLQDMDFAIRPGEIIGLPGPSGKGKSTLAKLLCGYLQPQKGSVTVDSSPLPRSGYCPVQMLFQHPELAMNPRWKIAEILMEGHPCEEEILHKLHIHKNWLDRYPHELSGGELQRIALARAMGPQTRYLVADEMTAMLDANTQALIWQVILAWAAEKKVGVLAISHDLHLLLQVANHIDMRFIE
jgi:peptide/nickel transport system ATP-binding protein